MQHIFSFTTIILFNPNRPFS